MDILHTVLDLFRSMGVFSSFDFRPLDFLPRLLAQEEGSLLEELAITLIVIPYFTSTSSAGPQSPLHLAASSYTPPQKFSLQALQGRNELLLRLSPCK